MLSIDRTRIGLILSASLIAESALANLCTVDIPDRATQEAERLEAEAFSRPIPFVPGPLLSSSPDPVNGIFDRDYNARLITCNRRRDDHGKQIEDAISATHEFDPDLQARVVKGHFAYLGLTRPFHLRYAYQLSREGGTWVVTVPMKFHWPDHPIEHTLDIPMKLANSLGLDAPDGICAVGATEFIPEPPELEPKYAPIRRGYIDHDFQGPQRGAWRAFQELNAVPIGEITESRWQQPTPPFRSTDAAKDFLDIPWDVVKYRKETACRVPEDLVMGDKSIQNHLRVFWRDTIREVWNRPGFRIDPVLLDCDRDTPDGTVNPCPTDVTHEQRNAWEKDETIWHLYMNQKPQHRPSFKRWIAKWNFMHTGVGSPTITHELGHYLGLDDEYAENPKRHPERHCDDVYPEAPDHYLMCGPDAERAGAQGVYAWLITRRYAVAETYQCKTDFDCAGTEFCDHGTATLGRNVCEPRRAEGESCSREQQCETGTTCRRFRCQTTERVPVGDACTEDLQCASGSCSRAGICQCRNNDDCSAGQYCDRGVAGIGANRCETLRAEGDRCTTNRQCGSGLRCQRLQCRTAN